MPRRSAPPHMLPLSLSLRSGVLAPSRPLSRALEVEPSTRQQAPEGAKESSWRSLGSHSPQPFFQLLESCDLFEKLPAPAGACPGSRRPEKAMQIPTFPLVETGGRRSPSVRSVIAVLNVDIPRIVRLEGPAIRAAPLGRTPWQPRVLPRRQRATEGPGT